MGCLIIIVFFAVWLPLVMFLRGWAVSVLWGWFVSPLFGYPALTTWQAYGLVLAACAILPFGDTSPDKSDEERKERLLNLAVKGVGGPLISVFFGWIVHNWLMGGS